MSAPAEKQTSGPCPTFWTQFCSRCFIYHHSPKSWTAAELTCISMGGNLVSVHSVYEHNFLRSMIDIVTAPNTRVWIGGHDGEKEGTWLWSDGSEPDYKRWAHGSPNNNQGNEHCMEMNYGGPYWNDAPCDQIKPFVCAKDSSH